MGNYTVFLDVRKSQEGQTNKKFYSKCSQNSRSQIVFRTDIFRKLTLGAPERLWVASVHAIKRFFFKFELFSSKVVSEEFFRRILKASLLTNSFFNIWRVTRGEMCVQEAFRLFKMCLCIKDKFFLESCAFVYNRV